MPLQALLNKACRGAQMMLAQNSEKKPCFLKQGKGTRAVETHY